MGVEGDDAIEEDSEELDEEELATRQQEEEEEEEEEEDEEEEEELVDMPVEGEEEYGESTVIRHCNPAASGSGPDFANTNVLRASSEPCPSGIG